MMHPLIKRFYRKYLPGKGLYYFWGITFLLLTITTTTYIPSLLKRGINVLENSGETLSSQDADQLMHVAGLIISLGIFLAIFRVLSRIIIFYPGRKIEAEIRQDYFNSIVTLSPKDLSSYETGDLISRGTNDVTSVRVMLSMGVLHSINSVLMASICLIQMYRISGRLTVFCLIPAPFIFLAVKHLSRRMMDKARVMQTQLGKLSEVIREHLSSHSLIGVFDVFDTLFERFLKVNRKYSKALQEHVRIRTVLFLLSANLSHIASFILLLFGSYDVINGRLDLGSFAAFSSYLGLMQDPLRSWGFLISIMQRGEICLKRIFEFIDRANSIAEKEANKKYQTEEIFIENLKENEPLISIRNLRFPQENEGFQLKIDSLDIQKGRKVGIFGPIGCGKTALLKLLTGNLDTNPRTLFFQGVDYQDIPSEILRRQFSFVPQENKHFAKTIRENIDQIRLNQELMMLRAANKRFYEFDQAYGISQLQPDIEQFPSGLDTLLGEHGINLSGGQRQRLSLFRALVKPHHILVLDDIVSSVDHETEKNILKELYSNLEEQDTVIFVSHRISALVPCDEILIMEEGSIVDQGKHEELLKRHAIYRDTYRHQVLEEQIEL